MDESKETFVGNTDNSHSEDEATENPIFEFKTLEIDEPKTADGKSKTDEICLSGGSGSNQFSSMDSDENRPFHVSFIKKGNKIFYRESSLEGNWTLLCSTEVGSCGRSQADLTLAAIQDLHEERKYLFSKSPYSYKKFTKVQSHEEVLLPSQVTDKLYICLENDYYRIDDHMQAGGKWMIFTQGDLKKLDHYWICLKKLFLKGSLMGLKASTALNPNSGVINCYTTDAENWVEVKKVAAAIRDAIDYPFIMYYKTNEASAQGQYREKGCRLISRYMFTVKGGFYEKDKFGRWEWI